MNSELRAFSSGRGLRFTCAIAKPGFDPGTFGLWAQHASHCATSLFFIPRMKKAYIAELCPLLCYLSDWPKINLEKCVARR